MISLTSAAALLLTAFGLSVMSVRWFIGWASARDAVAIENDRSMHSGRVPQGGGAPALVSVIAAVILMWGSGWQGALLLLAAAGLSALSFINDRQEIGFPVRLGAHAAAAALALVLIPGSVSLLGGWLPLALERAIALIAYVWFINLTNFMDGIDGITGVETISVAAGVLACVWAGGDDFSSPLGHGLGGIALGLIGAAAGFLVWNWPKARVFLGDAGSVPFGFLLGALLLYLAATVSTASALILPAYYLTDATRTLLQRFWRGEKVWQPHRTHVYQRAARAVGSHAAVVVRIAVCNAVLIAAALVAVHRPVLGLIAGAVAVFALMRDLERLAGK